MNDSIKKYLNELNEIESNLFQKDFLLTWDKSDNDIYQILKVAEILEQFRIQNISPKVFDSGLAISIFKDQSTRTRFSFSSAANLLGLNVQDLDEEKSQIGHGETVRETANMISFFSDIIGIRDDKYMGVGHEYMKQVGAALDDGFKNNVLMQRPGIINLQCDIDHPTQSLSDLLHLKHYFGSIENLKGKKIAMTWAYSPSYGKPLSVPQGVIGLMSRFGMEIELAFPEGYYLSPEVIDVANNNSKQSGGTFNIVNTMEDAFHEADIVYPKSWAPFEVMQKRTELLKAGDMDLLNDLEEYGLEKNKNYLDWECNEERMKLTKDGSALYMHCLPADISGVSCEFGEVQKEVFEKYRLETYREASFKPFIIASMMLNNQFEKPSQMLEEIYRKKELRK